MRVIIDRFEGEYAVCEKEDSIDDIMINIEKSKLPVEAKEGDILIISDGCIVIDVSGTQERKKIIQEFIDSLWE